MLQVSLDKMGLLSRGFDPYMQQRLGGEVHIRKLLWCKIGVWLVYCCRPGMLLGNL